MIFKITASASPSYGNFTLRNSKSSRATSHVCFVEQYLKSFCSSILVPSIIATSNSLEPTVANHTSLQIPYSIGKQDVLAFLGRNAKILSPAHGVPVHIIMDRATGKTMDCYVEFFSKADVQVTINKFKNRPSRPRMHERIVDIEMSSQEELMKELFPKAKNVEWKGQVPMVTQSDEPFNSGFKGFVTGEELVLLVKHAGFPHRVSWLWFFLFYFLTFADLPFSPVNVHAEMPVPPLREPNEYPRQMALVRGRLLHNCPA